MTILKIYISHGPGPDAINFHTDVKTGEFTHLILQARVKQTTVEKFVRENFPGINVEHVYLVKNKVVTKEEYEK